jgi:hypothetical protein
MEKQKILIVVVLCVVLVVASIAAFIYKDKLFTTRVVIRYSDGCTEEYVNRILVGPACVIENTTADIHGRRINTSIPQDILEKITYG